MRRKAIDSRKESQREQTTTENSKRQLEFPERENVPFSRVSTVTQKKGAELALRVTSLGRLTNITLKPKAESQKPKMKRERHYIRLRTQQHHKCMSIFTHVISNGG